MRFHRRSPHSICCTPSQSVVPRLNLWPPPPFINGHVDLGGRQGRSVPRADEFLLASLMSLTMRLLIASRMRGPTSWRRLFARCPDPPRCRSDSECLPRSVPRPPLSPEPVICCGQPGRLPRARLQRRLTDSHVLLDSSGDWGVETPA